MSARVGTSRGLLWVGPWLAGFVLFTLAPVLVSLGASVTDWSLVERPVWVGLENYRELWGDQRFVGSVRNTVVFAAANAAGTTLLALAIALVLEARVRGASVVRALVYLPTVVPVVSACVTWVWLLNPETGPVNAALAGLGVSGPNWLGDRAWALMTLAATGLWVIGGPMMVCTAGLRDVPASVREAACLDGASRWGRFVHVTLPMLSPALVFNAVMSVIWSVQVFAPVVIMTPRGMEDATRTLSVFVYESGFGYGRMGYACAAAWVQILVALALAGAAAGLARRWVHYRGA